MTARAGEPGGAETAGRVRPMGVPHDDVAAPAAPRFVEFAHRRDGMIHAMEGGLWLHRHQWKGRAMAHLVSVSRERLLAYGRAVGLPAERLQFKPLKDPRTGVRCPAWHWDLVGPYLPPRPCLAPAPAARPAQ